MDVYIIKVYEKYEIVHFNIYYALSMRKFGAMRAVFWVSCQNCTRRPISAARIGRKGLIAVLEFSRIKRHVVGGKCG